MKITTLTAALFLASASTAFAVDQSNAMRGFYQSNVSAWAQDPVLIDAIVAQNARTSGHDAARIEEMDQAWRAQVGTGSAPLVDEVLGNAAADFLRARVAEHGGAITEVFVMDALGLNVAASAATSDYWQGDEDKFLKTYPMGEGAMHFSEIEFDESSQSYQAQISVTLTDPDTGAVVGAMTVGIMADALM